MRCRIRASLLTPKTELQHRTSCQSHKVFLPQNVWRKFCRLHVRVWLTMTISFQPAQNSFLPPKIDHLKSPYREWSQALIQILETVSSCADTFSNVSDDKVLDEVLDSFEGGNYIKNIVEIYRVFKRIQVRSLSQLPSAPNDPGSIYRAQTWLVDRKLNAFCFLSCFLVGSFV